MFDFVAITAFSVKISTLWLVIQGEISHFVGRATPRKRGQWSCTNSALHSAGRWSYRDLVVQPLGVQRSEIACAVGSRFSLSVFGSVLITSFNTGRFCSDENFEINLYQRTLCLLCGRQQIVWLRLKACRSFWGHGALLRCQSYRQCRSELACHSVVAAPLPLPLLRFPSASRGLCLRLAWGHLQLIHEWPSALLL